MIPILTGSVVVIPLLFMGSLLAESFFGIPGLGSYTIDAIQAQDFAVVRSMVFIGSVLYIVGLAAHRSFLHIGGPAHQARMTPVVLATDAFSGCSSPRSSSTRSTAAAGRISRRRGSASSNRKPRWFRP